MTLLAGSLSKFSMTTLAPTGASSHEPTVPDSPTVVAGGTFFSPRFTAQKRALANQDESFEKKLSPREQQIMGYMGTGFTDAEIDELEANVARAEAAHKAGNFEERTRHHQAFHVLLAKATGTYAIFTPSQAAAA